jgi:hypothetical protein
MPVDQSTDKAQFGHGALQFGCRSVGPLRRQGRETAESVGISAHRLGQVIVGTARQFDGVRDIGLVLDARVEQRQDLEIDAGDIHLLETKRAAVIQPLVGDRVVGPQPGAHDVVGAGRIPGVMLLERDQRHGTSAVGRGNLTASSASARVLMRVLGFRDARGGGTA